MRHEIHVKEELRLSFSRPDSAQLINELEDIAQQAGRPLHHWPALLELIQTLNEAEHQFQSRPGFSDRRDT